MNGHIENMYTSRGGMLISMFKYLFFYLYRQLQVMNSFKYVNMEIDLRLEIINTDLSLGGHGFI